MIPRLFAANSTDFSSNGIGPLRDGSGWSVRQTVNEEYELQFSYPRTGARFQDIVSRAIVIAKPDPISDEQAFRIYRIVKSLSNDAVTVYANHISYDLSGYPVAPFSAQDVGTAMSGLAGNLMVSSPFQLRTTKTTTAKFNLTKPCSARSALGGMEGSILDTYRGEYEFDNFLVTLMDRRGADHGVSIRYGKNLTTLDQDANCAQVYTAVVPYWASEQEETVVGDLIPVPGSFDYDKVLPLDLSGEFQEKPSKSTLNSRAASYIQQEELGVPDISWRIEFQTLEKSPEYSGMNLLESINIGDTVEVVFDRMGISAKARAVTVDYDPVLERYNSVTLGRVKSDITSTIVSQSKDIDKKPTKSMVYQISEQLSQAMLGINGGCVRLLDTNADGTPDELYIADNSDPAQALKVWRFNYEGWAVSQTGYDGPYIMGATIKDGLLADFVTAANLTAGTIQSKDGKTFYLNLDDGVLRMSSHSQIVDDEGNMQQLATQKDIEDIELRPGPQGVGVESTVAYYYLSTSSTSQTGGSWSTTIPAWVDGKYYWQKFKTTYTDGTTAETAPVCITGGKGAKGEQGLRGLQGEQGISGATGTRGTGLWSVTTAPSSYTTQTGGFTPTYRMSLSTVKSQSGATNILVGDQIRYSYYTYPVGYVDSSYVYMGARVSIRGATGAKGDQGEQGKGVASIEVEFYLSTDNKSCVGGSWQTTMPEWSVGKYLWTRNKITYSNPTSVAYTEPLCDSSWEAINALRIGARNFLQQSKAMVGWTRDWSSGGSVDYQQWVETNDGFVVFNALTGSPVKSRWFNSRPPLNYADTGLRGKEVTVSWDARSDEADIINATTDEGMICEIDLCTPDSTTRAKYRLKYLYAKNYPLSNDWQRYSCTLKLDDDLWSINTTSYPDYVIDENTRIFVRMYAYSTHAMQIKCVKLAEGNVPTDWTPAPEDIANELTSEIEEVNKALVQQESDMKATNEGFVLEALKGYVGQNEYLSFTEHVESSLKIAAEAIDMNFADSVVAKLNESISGVSEEFNKLRSAVEKHIEFSLNGITITGSSGISLTLDNSGIVFSKDGRSFGTWDGNNFHTGNIVVDVNERAQFGNFAFIPRSDGSLSFLKVGG